MLWVVDGTRAKKTAEPEARKRLAWGEAKRNPRNDRRHVHILHGDPEGREKEAIGGCGNEFRLVRFSRPFRARCMDAG